MKLSLFLRLFFAIGGCTSGAILIALVVQNRSLSADLEDAARERIEGASRAAESLVASHISSVAAQYEVVARTPQLRATVDSNDGPTLTHYAQTLLTKERATQLAFLDVGGSVAASAGAAIFDPLEVNENTLLVQGEAAFVAISIPLVTAERPLGRLVSIVPITEELTDSWSQLIGATVLFTPPDEHFRGLTVEIDRFAPVLITIATTLEREIASRLHARMNLLVAGFLALGVALFASLYYSRGFTRPILEIKNATDQIGEGQLATRIEVSRRDELGDVAHSINRMAERIQQSAHVIQHANDSLLESNAQIARARDRSEQESRAKSEFLSHKEPALKESIEQVLSSIDLLAASPMNEETMRLIRTARGSATRLFWQMSGILDLSRLELDNLKLDTVDFQPGEIVEELTAACAPKAVAGVRLVAAVSPEAPSTVRGDPERVKQILSHLLRNAIAHTPAGEIVVSVGSGERHRDGVDLCFSVRDSGSGLIPEALTALKESLASRDSLTALEIEGTGVGLALCRRLAERLEGTIEVEQSAGGGLNFTVTLPVPVTDGQDSKVLYLLRAVDLDAMRVLVVDPSDSGRESLATQIRAWGVTTETESDPQKFFERAHAAVTAHEPYPLVFLHVSEWTPVLEKQLAALHRSRTLQSTRVIALSSLDTLPTAAAEATRHGAEGEEKETRDEEADGGFTFAACISDPPTRREILDAIIDARGGPRVDLRTSYRFTAADEVI